MSVKETDIGEILDKVKQHAAQGFFLITTTLPSSGLKKKLDALDVSSGGEIYTRVWDAAELSKLLTTKEGLHILKMYLPESYSRLVDIEFVEPALEALRNHLPADAFIRDSPDGFPRLPTTVTRRAPSWESGFSRHVASARA